MQREGWPFVAIDVRRQRRVVEELNLGMRNGRQRHIFAADGRSGQEFRDELQHVDIIEILEDGQPDLAVVDAGVRCDIAEAADGIGQHSHDDRRAVNAVDRVRFDAEERRLMALEGLEAGQEIG